MIGQVKGKMTAIRSVLASWAAGYAQVVKEALRFYRRLLTNDLGLPAWLWTLMMLSFVAWLVMRMLSVR